MNLDFHYYGTYVAAKLAGYDDKTAQTIAYAAQYVDESTLGTLQSGGTPYLSKPGFILRPTIQDNSELALIDTVNWSEASLYQTYNAWIPFHFLPGNYGSNTNKVTYSGPTRDNGYVSYWEWDDESAEQFKLLCRTNSLLVGQMINDLVTTDYGNYTNYMIGLRMHVMADTWAHKNYAGINAWFINNVNNYNTPVYDPIPSYMPNVLNYNSMSYLGHFRSGHVPDYPWATIDYQPQWSNSSQHLDNPADFRYAFLQMVEALKCIKGKTTFAVNKYAPIDQNTDDIIKNILSTAPKNYDQSQIWLNNIPKITINYTKLNVPEVYDNKKWFNEMQKADDKNKTSYYYFNYCASKHFDFIEKKLAENAIYFNKTPSSNVLTVQLKHQSSGKYIGPISRSFYQYYPEMSNKFNAEALEIVMAHEKPLQHGDIVKIKTNDPEAGQYNYLGTLGSAAIPLQYYQKDYDVNKQKWQIEKVDLRNGSTINNGDSIRIKYRGNMADTGDIYLAPYEYEGGMFLNTDSEPNNANWSLYDPSELLKKQYYHIINQYSGKFMDVKGVSTNAGANIQEYHYNGEANQLFLLIPQEDYFIIMAKNSGLVFDIEDCSLNKGANLIQNEYDGSDNQKFILTKIDRDYYMIKALHSGLVLDVSDGDDGTNIVQNPYTGSSTQKFHFSLYENIYFRINEPCRNHNVTANDDNDVLEVIDLKTDDSQSFCLVDVGGGYYYIVSKSENEVLTIADDGKADNYGVVLSQDRNKDSQKFMLIRNGVNSFRIMNKNSGRVLSMSSPGSSLVQIDDGDNYYLQDFRFIYEEYYYIINKNSGKFLVVDDTSTDSGKHIRQCRYIGSNSQKFLLCSDDTDYYKIIIKKSNKLFDVEKSSVSDNAKIIQNSSNGNNSQLFSLRAGSDYFYNIINKNSSKQLDAVDKNEDTDIVQKSAQNIDSQKFIFSPCGPSNLYIQAKNSKKFLTVKDNSKDDNKEIIEQDYNNKSSQMYQFIKVTANQIIRDRDRSNPNPQDQYYYIVNTNSNKVLTVKNASTDNNVSIIQTEDNWQDEQKFSLTITEDNCIKIKNKKSGKILTVNSSGALQQSSDIGGDNQLFRFIVNPKIDIKKIHDEL